MGNHDGSDSSSSAESGTPIPLDVIPLHSTNLLTVLDDTGTILYESPSIERIFGFPQDKLVGDPVATYFHPADREDVLEAFQTVVELEEYAVEAAEYRHEQADGSYLWVESVASSNPTPDGYYVVNTRDISERKAREQELEYSNARLDEFASVVSHDLRNPLNVAQGRVELTQETGDIGHLDDVVRAHDRMETLIGDLLTLAHAGRSIQEVEPVDLEAVSEDCWHTVTTGTSRLRVAIEQPILADRSRLRQLLENLMRNALEHGADQVTIGKLVTQAGFFVTDDGSGISEADRDQVFESGYSTKDDGTGLGLTIVTDVADAHGWEVSVTESAAGGAQFDITGVEFR